MATATAERSAEAPKGQSAKILVHNRESYLLTINRKSIPITRMENGKEVQILEKHPKTGETLPAVAIPAPLNLPPGVSAVDRRVWNEVKEEPLLRLRLTGKLADGSPLPRNVAMIGLNPDQVIAGEPTLRVVADSDELPTANALAIIVATFDLDLLREWADQADTRPVKDAIELQQLRVKDPKRYESEVEQRKRSARL